MATTKLYLDTRAASKDKAPIKLAVSHRGKTAYLSLGVYIAVNQWDKATTRVINHKNKVAINAYLQGRKLSADEALICYISKNVMRNVSAIQLRDYISSYIDGAKSEPKNLFKDQFLSFMNTKSGGTLRIYKTTFNRISAFCDIDSLTFEDITKDWLLRFDDFMSMTAPSRNARNIHFICIRSVFNYAIDNDVTSCYPFRKFRIRREITAKRSLTVEQIRELFSYPVQPYEVKYVDMFKLIFFLIGINITDLVHLKSITNDGRIEYKRAKTHRLYSVKVEPEAMEIINRYRGQEFLLSCIDNRSGYTHYAAQLNKSLQKIGPKVGNHRGKRKSVNPLYPQLTTYWARHSWATIAASLDIPKETIAHALGHGGNSVTDIYIDFDMRKVDEANRRVIDWVLYGKK